MSAVSVGGAEIRGQMKEGYEEILSEEAVAFLCQLQRKFNPVRHELLKKRLLLQESLDRGEKLAFPVETAEIREADWTVAPIPDDLQDRRVEITGPVDRKMVINALNSGASVFMADFEDSNSPIWDNNVQGQLNLRDAILRTIEFTAPNGKHYKLKGEVAVLMCRPRGWHLVEKPMLVDGEPISGSLFDFGLYLFHNANNLKKIGSGPYYYLPKLETYHEARLWNDVFVHAQDALGIPQGTIRATVLLETITAAFQMDEILYELKDHSAGLNCGRWDYIFSFIKKHRLHPENLMPNRAQVGMTRHFLNSYVQLLIKTCHRRGIHAMGGMAAQIPIKSDPVANEQALEKVRQDKLREVKAGHDGTWVAHPGLVPLARDVFDGSMKTPNQIDNKRAGVDIKAEDLLKVPDGTITEQGLRINVDVGVQYLAAWLGGNGCVPIYNLMEDAATAEISRTQVWQWIHHKASLDDGRTVTPGLVKQIMTEEMTNLEQRLGEHFDRKNFDLASRLFMEMMTGEDFPEFLTLVAYEYL